MQGLLDCCSELCDDIGTHQIQDEQPDHDNEAHMHHELGAEMGFEYSLDSALFLVLRSKVMSSRLTLTVVSLQILLRPDDNVADAVGIIDHAAHLVQLL